MKAEKTKQISLTDPDSRMMTKLLSRNDMSYNVQTAVDSKHSLIANYSVTNACNDLNQLSGMAKTVKESYNLSKLEVTADAGYFNGKELKECHDNDIATYVPNKRNQKASNPDFTYIAETDCYQCPMGKLLRNYSRDNSNNVTIYTPNQKHVRDVQPWSYVQGSGRDLREYIKVIMRSMLSIRPKSIR